MRVVALVSGGKDSCYNMIQCVAAGHDIVALANLKPENKDELDSYMFQTVGHQGIELYAEAMGVPLFRMPTQGVALVHDQLYTPTPEDEVEDLYQLLKHVQESVNIEAVAVGAILSDYQRIRVENVCNRLGLVALAYLWRRDQGELLQEMIDCNVQALIIKVAALGLDPSKHLGLNLSELQPHIIKMKDKYGLNICGEGGEYETFTLDCPLFVKTIIIDEFETVIHSDDAIAPVGYLNFTSFHLEDKEGMDISMPLSDRIADLDVKTWRELIADLDEDVTETKLIRRGEPDEDSLEEPPPPLTPTNNTNINIDTMIESSSDETSPNEKKLNDEDSPDGTCDLIEAQMQENESGWCWFEGIHGHGANILEATQHALATLNNLVSSHSMSLSHIVAVTVFLRDMSEFSVLNQEYLREFSSDHPPPVRACVAVPLPASHPVAIEALAHRDLESRHAMHVQGISHWAPANIGPYSQAIRMGDFIHVAGQIAMVPSTMQLVEGGARKQCRLALRHVGRIVRAMDSNTQLRDVVQGICYVTHPSYIPEARKEWEKRTNNAIVDYLVVSHLPKGALLEWHVWAHRDNNRFEYEETGCCIGDFRISIRRRWNYENNVSAVVCYVSTASSNSGPLVSGSGEESSPHVNDPSSMSDEILAEIISYALGKLLRDTAQNTVCYLRLFYKTGRAPSLNRIHGLFSSPTLSQYNVIHSIIPILEMHSPHTFLSICGVRH